MFVCGWHVVDMVCASLRPRPSDGDVGMNRLSWRLVLSICAVPFHAAPWHLLPALELTSS